MCRGQPVTLMAAPVLGARFVYSERLVDERAEGLHPVRYRLPRALRGEMRGRRVAIVNDVISAGSAVRGTLQDLVTHGAQVVAVAALAALGGSASELAREGGVALESLPRFPTSCGRRRNVSCARPAFRSSTQAGKETSHEMLAGS